MAIETKKPETSGTAGGALASPKAMQASKPDPDLIQAIKAARAKLGPEERERLDKALLKSADEGDANKVIRLLNAGASSKAYTEDNYTALTLAVSSGHKEVALALIAAGSGTRCCFGGFTGKNMSSWAEGVDE